MSLNHVKALWQANKAAYGAIVTMPSPQVVQVLARSGFDFLLIDMEHGPIDIASAHAMILATAGTPAIPMVRIAANLPWLAKLLLGAGALDICVPMVCTRGEAEAAARAVRYPPQGDRMWGPFYAPLRWDMPMGEYMRAADEEVISMITIEHADAVRKIEDIVEAGGVDVAIIGPGDLATSLGHLGQRDHPEVEAAIREAETGILKSRLILGGVAFSSEEARRKVEAGYRMIFLGLDWSLLQQGCTAVLNGVPR